MSSLSARLPPNINIVITIRENILSISLQRCELMHDPLRER